VIRLAIVAGIRLYREGLAQILGSQPGMAVVQAAPDVHSLTESAPSVSADIVLLDMALPDALAGINDILQARPEARVVALSVDESDEELVACAEAGASAFVHREGSLAQLVEVIYAAARDEAQVSPHATALILRRLSALARERRPDADHALTAREVEIVRLIAHGLSNKEIAAQLQITLSTVKNHVHNILEKLGAQGRTELAVRFAKPEWREGSRSSQDRTIYQAERRG
jgi:two-component system, NarL family, nitrate/nitrite response regulator NarL